MKQKQALRGFILSSAVRMKVIKALRKTPMRQSEIAKKLRKPHQNISLVLQQLEEVKLVECLTPKKKAWKVYEITELGREVLGLC